MPATHNHDGYHPEPTPSVIIAVYNHFEWLRLVLEGLRHQSVRKFQIILADDGSDETTVKHIRQYTAGHPEMEIVHIWHEDDGWRKNIALNKAVTQASGDYLCFLDSDCIPAPNWLKDHLRLARPKTIIAGRRATFAPEMSKGMLQRTTGNLIGCNFGIYRKDLLDINGFDERYLGPGLGEDIDIAYRLRFNGCRILKVPHQALTIHRHHPTSVSTVASKTDNVAILEDTKKRRTTRPLYGIVKAAETKEV